MAETLLKTVCGVAISVTDAGKFKAKVNGQLKVVANLRDLEKAIAETVAGNSVTIMALVGSSYHSPDSIKVWEVISYAGKPKRGYYSDQYRVKRSNYGEQNLSEVISFPADCFEYDAAVKEEYLAMQKRQEAELNELTKRHGEEQKEIKSRMKRVTSERLQQMLVEVNQAETTETE